jgi:hypothetical protein
MQAMGKVAISAAVGVVVAAALLAGVYLGIRISPVLLMTVAAALSVGAATAVLTRYALDRPKEKPRGNELLGKRLRDVKELVAAFPRGGGAVQLSIRPFTAIDELDVVKHPASYAARDIIVTFKDAGKGATNPAATFNPIVLRNLFVALKDQPNFMHVFLVNKHDEFVGYIPSFRAKAVFTGGNASDQIAKYIIDVLNDHVKSASLREIGGLSNTDIISDEAKIVDARARMEGGFNRLVVLHNGRHRKPVGLLHSEQLLAVTKPNG